MTLQRVVVLGMLTKYLLNNTLLKQLINYRLDEEEEDEIFTLNQPCQLPWSMMQVAISDFYQLWQAVISGFPRVQA